MKAIAQKFALVMSSFLMTLFFCEIFVRLFLPQQLIVRRPDIWRSDGTFGYRHQENVNTLINRGLGTVHVITDSNGYRVNRSRSESKTEPDISILALGDSFIEGLAVENEFTIPGLILKYLENKYRRTVHVDNAAVSGWNPNHYLLEARRALAKKQYTLGIVFLYVGNDVITKKVGSFQAVTPRPTTLDHKIRLPNSLKLKEIIQAILYPIRDFLETRSHLFVLAKQAGRIPLARLGLTTSRYSGYSIFEVDKASSPKWVITAEVCEEIRNEFSKYGIPVFFVLLPTVIQVYEGVLKEYIWGLGLDQQSIDPHQPNKLLKAEFEARRLQLADPLEYMSRKAKNGHKMYGAVDRHFNEDGHQIVSEYIVPIVESYTEMAINTAAGF